MAINYGTEELRARCEYTFIDEMHAYLSTGWERLNMKKTLKTKYWASEMKTINSLIKDAYQVPAQKKALKKSVNPVFTELDQTIDACFYLKQKLSPDILTPLFYAIRSTPDEIRNKNFPSIFADIRLWSDILEKDIVRPNLIMSELRNKGYCMNKFISPVP